MHPTQQKFADLQIFEDHSAADNQLEVSLPLFSTCWTDRHQWWVEVKFEWKPGSSDQSARTSSVSLRLEIDEWKADIMHLQVKGNGVTNLIEF